MTYPTFSQHLRKSMITPSRFLHVLGMVPWLFMGIIGIWDDYEKLFYLFGIWFGIACAISFLEHTISFFTSKYWKDL